jgi:hypothetical protein
VRISISIRKVVGAGDFELLDAERSSRRITAGVLLGGESPAIEITRGERPRAGLKSRSTHLIAETVMNPRNLRR